MRPNDVDGSKQYLSVYHHDNVTIGIEEEALHSPQPACFIGKVEQKKFFDYQFTKIYNINSKFDLFSSLYLVFSKVPDDFDFLKVFELLFKIYKVFSLTFNPHVAYMMHFLERFVFKMDFSDPAPVVFTQKMIEIVMVLVK